MDRMVDLVQSMNGWYVLGLIVALGAITIALLQLVDDLFPIRNAFNWYQLREWIRQRVSQYERQRNNPLGQPVPEEIVPITAQDAYALLVWHATGGELVFFSLSIDQLVAQINAAAQIALDNPALNFSLLAAISQPTEPTLQSVLLPSAVERYVLPNQQLASRPQGTQFSDLATLFRRPSAPAPHAASVEMDAAYLDARNRIWQRIQRNLDGLQIHLNNRSSWFNQVLALAISIGIAFGIWLGLPQASRPPWYLVLLVGVAAGYAAPFVGDIVIAIRRLGRR